MTSAGTPAGAFLAGDVEGRPNMQEYGSMSRSSVRSINVQQIVERLREECFQAHRGAFWWDEARRVAVAFGNDGYDRDPRTKREVEALRRLLRKLGGEELGFATAGDGYSWAMACRLPEEGDLDGIEEWLWCGWLGEEDPKPESEFPESVFARLQRKIAGATLKMAGLA